MRGSISQCVRDELCAMSGSISQCVRDGLCAMRGSISQRVCDELCVVSGSICLLGLSILLLAAGAVLLRTRGRQQVRGRLGPGGPLGAGGGRGSPQAGHRAPFLCPQGDGWSRRCWRSRQRATAPEKRKSPAGVPCTPGVPGGYVPGAGQGRAGPRQRRTVPGGPSGPSPAPLAPLPLFQAESGGQTTAAPTAARLPRSCSD